MGALKLHTEQNDTGLKVVYGGLYEIKKVVQRWLSVDPKAHEFPWQSPYAAMDNNPINYNDPTGMSAEDPINKDIGNSSSEGNSGETSYNEVDICPTCPTGSEWDEARNSKDNFTYESAIDDVHLTGQEVTVTGEGQSNDVVRNYGGDGSGSFSDNSMKVMDVINQYNLLANVWDAIAYSYSGQDRLGNKMTLTEANLKAVSIIPIGKFGVTISSFEHIFRNAAGHVNPTSIFSQRRFMRLFSNVASNPNNLVPTVNAAAAAAGVQTFQQTYRSGGQVWVQVLNGQIRNAGVNR